MRKNKYDFIDVDELASQMSNAPQKLMGDIYTEFLREIMQEGADADAATIKFSKKISRLCVR